MPATGGTLAIISCSETYAQIEPSRFFNLAANNSKVVKTSGGRTQEAIHSLYSIDQSSRIGMIIVLHHTTGCAHIPYEADANMRTEIAGLRASPHIRRDIPIAGYVLNIHTNQFYEVNIVRSSEEEATRQRVLSEMEDFGPYWS